LKRGFNFFIKHRTLKILVLDLILISTTTFLIYWYFQSLLGLLKVDISLYGIVGSGFNLFGMLIEEERLE